MWLCAVGTFRARNGVSAVPRVEPSLKVVLANQESGIEYQSINQSINQSSRQAQGGGKQKANKKYNKQLKHDLRASLYTTQPQNLRYRNPHIFWPAKRLHRALGSTPLHPAGRALIRGEIVAAATARRNAQTPHFEPRERFTVHVSAGALGGTRWEPRDGRGEGRGMGQSFACWRGLVFKL